MHALFHAAPLHYLPHILSDGALYAQSVLIAHHIPPRATARRRDKMLGLSDYVHLSLDSQTPLLADKLSLGYPHALLVFAAAPILAQPETALLPYNTKAWRAKAAYAPVTDPAEKASLLQSHTQQGHYPSLEVLVKYGLSLTALQQIAFLTDTERALILNLLGPLDLTAPAPLVTDPSLFPDRGSYNPVTIEQIAAYFTACDQSATLLPPPDIPFD